MEDYNKFIKEFKQSIYTLKQKYSDYIFLCIGTDKITGDAFGPLVGKYLKNLIEKEYENLFVKGTLENPVSYKNIDMVLTEINLKYKNPCLIVIDAALSTEENIGKIIVSNQKTNLGISLNRTTYNIGEISVKGVVAKDYKIPKYNFYTLQNTSLNLVMQLAEITAYGIYAAIS